MGNCACNLHRREQREPQLASDCAALGGDDSSAVLERIAAAPDPEGPEAAAYNELLRALAECLKALPENLKEVVRMRIEQGMTLAEVAAKIAVSVATVCRWEEKALTLLRGWLLKKGFTRDEVIQLLVAHDT